MAAIEVIEYDAAKGELKKIYDKLIKERGDLAEVHKIQSLNPASITAHMDLYMAVMFGKSPLKRATREMLGVVVSRTNDCEYCQQHHADALLHYWKDEKKVKKFRKNYSNIELSERDEKLCNYASKLTKKPQKAASGKFIKPLKKIGLTDREILDATLVISYFNFVNRIVLSLGIDLEENTGTYIY